MFSKYKRAGLGTSYSPGDKIFKQGGVGASLFIVTQGIVALVLNTGHRKVRLGTLEKSDIFGIPHLFGQEARYCTAVALTDVRITKLDKDLILEKMHTDPSLMFRICKMLNNRLMSLVEVCPCECNDAGKCESDIGDDL